MTPTYAPGVRWYFHAGASDLSGLRAMDSLVGTSASELFSEIENEPVNLKPLRTGGGSTVAWASCPLSATTLGAQTFFVNLWAAEATANVNLRPLCALKLRHAANGSVVSLATAGSSTEYPLSTAAVTVTGQIAPAVTISEGDRFVVECFSVPVAPGSVDSADPDLTVRYDSDVADSAESYFELAQVTGCVGSVLPTATPSVTPSATPSPSGSVTPTIPAATPTPTVMATAGAEICDDCIDNDGNGDVDRADAACTAPADGGGAGMDDANGEGKAVFACQQALGRAGKSFAAARLKALAGCVTDAFRCAQEDPSAECYAESGARCGGKLAKVDAQRPKLAATIAKRCGVPALAAARLGDPIGLGFDGESAACTAAGVATLDDVADVTACVTARHACVVDRLVADVVPRARELLTLVGRDPAVDAPCLPATAGTGTSTHDTLVECLGAFTKAGARLLQTRTNGQQRCAEAVVRCVQVRADDPTCLDKAQVRCAKLATTSNAAQADFVEAVGKRCPADSLAAILDASGFAFEERAATCNALGITLDSVPALADCAGRVHACRIDQVVESRTPRLRELLGLVE